MLLMTEEVQLNQELVCRSPVQRWNHIRKSFMEGPLAVSDRPLIRQGPSTPL
ncbi:thf1 domain protein [Synechococcus sp. PROS-9-1]|nr:thf1 domain protein [Synechococcus sp. PROS-9-1]